MQLYMLTINCIDRCELDFAKMMWKTLPQVEKERKRKNEKSTKRRKERNEWWKETL